MNQKYLSNCLVALVVFVTFAFFSSDIQAITPGKWSFKDSYLLYPKNQKFFPKKEVVYDAKGKLVLTSYLDFQNGLLVGERFESNGAIEGTTIYQYDKSNRLTKEITKDSNSKTTESREYIYKGNVLFKIRIFSETGNLYMDSNIYQWDGDLIKSGDLTWMDTKDKEKILTENKEGKKQMSLLDEKKQPIAYVTFIYNDGKQLVERQFTQGNSHRKNQFLYNGEGRLKEFSFHVKQEGKWVLEKTHKIEY
ncbi:MAG: hypothetical protein JJT78_02135 [Leptospira sp.]|nr:hypothetical protein [Leptospira sp.]